MGIGIPVLIPASTLISRVSRWLRDWTQRDIVAGDELNGIRQPSFTALVNDIYVFQCVDLESLRSAEAHPPEPAYQRS